jgi:uncharacterized membrane protein
MHSTALRGSQVSAGTPPEAALATPRFDRLDALRGFALVWMAVFHFCFDLSHAGLLQANFYVDALWTNQRTVILSLFLLCAGAGQAIATAQGQSWARFWRRWSQVVGCALLVSLGSYWMFPQSYIYFGVLHGMAVMLIIARLSAGLGAWLVPLGALAWMLPHWVSHPSFDTRLTSILGLVTHKPITEDYVPILPWLGMMWWGLAGTQWVLKRRAAWLSGPQPAQAKTPSLSGGLGFLGRWSLTFYMLHQPILLGALELFLMFRRSL